MPSLANFFTSVLVGGMLFVFLRRIYRSKPLTRFQPSMFYHRIRSGQSFAWPSQFMSFFYAMKGNVGVDSSWHHTTGNFFTGISCGKVARILFGDWSVHHLFCVHNGNPEFFVLSNFGYSKLGFVTRDAHWFGVRICGFSRNTNPSEICNISSYNSPENIVWT